MDGKEERLYKTLISYLQEDYKNRIIAIDKEIKKIEDTIFEKSGWRRTPNGYSLTTNINEDSTGLKEQNRYKIYRNENGYFIRSDSNPANEHFRERNEVEKAFFYKYEQLLQQLHLLLEEKEKILGGECTLANEDNREMFTNISDNLGYQKKQELNK